MADTEQVKARKEPSLLAQAGILAAMTVAALGAGWMSGAYLKGTETPAPPPALQDEAGQEADPAATPPQDGKGAVLAKLPSIITNLAAPANVWVRMDATVVFDAPQPPELVEAIHQDMLAFLRTVRMHQVEGASGFQHLKADLKERAAIRSDGHARDVLIRTLLFE